MATPPGGNLGSTKVALALVVGDDDAPLLPVLRLAGVSESVVLAGDVVLSGTDADEAGAGSDVSRACRR